MAVEVTNPNFGKDGLKDTLRGTLRAHRENSDALLNLGEGKEHTDPRPVYDPLHIDNQWPKMLHHAVKGEKAVGRNLKGLPADSQDALKLRASIIRTNQQEYDALLKQGWQAEPFPKPHVTVNDPAAEKAELLRKNAELQGQITMQQQQHQRLADLVEKLLAAQGAPSATADPEKS